MKINKKIEPFKVRSFQPFEVGDQSPSFEVEIVGFLRVLGVFKGRW